MLAEVLVRSSRTCFGLAAAAAMTVVSLTSCSAARVEGLDDQRMQSQAIHDYMSAEELVLSNPGASQSELVKMAAPLGSAVQKAVPLAWDSFAEVARSFGAPEATGLDARIEVQSSKLVSSSEHEQVVSAEMVFTVLPGADDDGSVAPGVWTDEHILSLKDTGSGWAVVSDEYAPLVSED